MEALKICVLVLSSLLIAIIFGQYLFCYVYAFQKPTSFSVDSIYKTYASAVAGLSIKCNFDAHAPSWDGITDEKGTFNNINDAYNKLNYSIKAISDYLFIGTTHQFSLNERQTPWLKTAGEMVLAIWFCFVLSLLFPKKSQQKLFPYIFPSYG